MSNTIAMKPDHLCRSCRFTAKSIQSICSLIRPSKPVQALTESEIKANAVCGIFVDGAQQRALGPVDKRLGELSRLACVFDVNATSDATVRSTFMDSRVSICVPL